MNILFVAHRAPYPPNDGAKIRAYNLIKFLAQDHQVSVASLSLSDKEKSAEADLAKICHRAHIEPLNANAQKIRAALAIPGSTPSSFAYFWSEALARRIRQWHQEQSFDLAISYSACSERYTAGVDAKWAINDMVDLDSAKWEAYSKQSKGPKRWFFAREAHKTNQHERRIASTCDLVTVTTRLEHQDLLELNPKAKTTWFSNGVDTVFFAPDTSPEYGDEVCFLGRMDYQPNIDACLFFANSVMPILLKTNPNARFTIVGSNPAKQVLGLEKLKSVTVTGFVDDVRPYAKRAACMVAPLTVARGVQNKILEGMAMGLPVVASESAADGVDAIPGEHLLTAQSAQEFAQACASLMKDHSLRKTLASRARERMLSHHTWDHSLHRFTQALNELTN